MGGDRIPGADLIEEGLADLRAGAVSVASLLVSIGAPRLRRLGLDVPAPLADPGSTHSRYNALVRRLTSFERALACTR
jgi:hypothetical protein